MIYLVNSNKDGGEIKGFSNRRYALNRTNLISY